MRVRVNKAVENYNNGYNCAQSILCAYKDVINIDEVTAYKIGECFGSGIAGMKDICGAVNAMFIVLSYVYSDGILGSKKSRRETYKKINEATDKFKLKYKYKSILCRDIIFNQAGIGCVQKVVDAANVLEDMLEEIGK